MFAIAAFALVGMAGAPAFASGHQVVMNATVSGNDGHTDSNICGGGESIYSSLQAQLSGGGDYVRVTMDAEDCGSHTYSTVTVTVNGNHYGTYGTSADYKIVSFYGDLNSGDSVRATINYTY